MTSMTHDTAQNITQEAETVQPSSDREHCWGSPSDHRVTITQPDCPEWCEVSREDHEAEAWSRNASWFAHYRWVTVGTFASISVGSVQMFAEEIEPGEEAKAAAELVPRIWVEQTDLGDGMSAAQALELADALSDVAGRERPVVAIFDAGREYQRRVDDRQEVMVSVGDASQLTGLSRREIRQAIRKGELEAVKRSRRYAIPLQALGEWRPKVS